VVTVLVRADEEKVTPSVESTVRSRTLAFGILNRLNKFWEATLTLIQSPARHFGGGVKTKQGAAMTTPPGVSIDIHWSGLLDASPKAHSITVLVAVVVETDG